MASPLLTVKQIEAADQVGVKLEITEGLPTWEFHPTARHQAVELAILRSLRAAPEASGYARYPLHDVLISFPDGSIKRPDISIFYQVPRELDAVITLVPKAIIEIVSADSRYKDYHLNPPFYLKHGVLDVIVVDPATSEITWFTQSGEQKLRSPQTLELQCECLIDV